MILNSDLKKTRRLGNPERQILTFCEPQVPLRQQSCQKRALNIFVIHSLHYLMILWNQKVILKLGQNQNGIKKKRDSVY